MSSGRQTPRHRVDRHRRVGPRDDIRVEPRHRRQPAGDRASRQPRLAIAHPDHGPVAALMGEELEHVGRLNVDRVFVDDGEERLQVERDRPQRVRSGSTRDELQITVDQRITQLEAGLTRSRRRTDQARRRKSSAQARSTRRTLADVRKITRVLGVWGRSLRARCGVGSKCSLVRTALPLLQARPVSIAGDGCTPSVPAGESPRTMSRTEPWLLRLPVLGGE